MKEIKTYTLRDIHGDGLEHSEDEIVALIENGSLPDRRKKVKIRENVDLFNMSEHLDKEVSDEIDDKDSKDDQIVRKNTTKVFHNSYFDGNVEMMNYDTKKIKVVTQQEDYFYKSTDLSEFDPITLDIYQKCEDIILNTWCHSEYYKKYNNCLGQDIPIPIMIKIFDMCVKSLNNSNIEGLTNMIKVISILEFFDLDYQKAFSKIIPERIYVEIASQIYDKHIKTNKEKELGNIMLF